MGYAFTPVPAPQLPVIGSDLAFPVHRIYCVGRNYAEHAREMGHDPDREPPFFFQKNPDNLRLDGRFPYPPGSSDVQFEIELAVALAAGGADLTLAAADAAIFGYATALDMTRRDLQGLAKKAGQPWEVGKAFEHSAPCTAITRRKDCGRLVAGPITLDVNGQRRQSGDLAQMIWDIPNQIAILSTLFTLAPGDIIMTGTPAGVGAIVRGDRMEGRITNLPPLAVTVV